MTTFSPIADTYTDFQGLNQLKTQARNKSPEAIRAVARQFETLFVQMMLKSMRDANIGEGLFDNDQGKIFQEMFDKQVSLDMTKHQSIGLSAMIVKQLGGQESKTQSDAGDMNRGFDLLTAKRFSITNARSTLIERDDGNINVSKTPQEFVKSLWPHATKAANQLGVDPEVLIAQAALETGWGKSMIKNDDAGTSFNLFGIKAGRSWQGERANVTTTEFENGSMASKKETFRVYGSIGESFSDYVSLIKNSDRYSNAVEFAPDSDAYLDALQNAGYATDPNYANKIKGIMGDNLFQKIVTQFKKG